jgi:hypothetical protein
MEERDYLVIDLVKDLLGPRSGPFEYLPPERDPRNEYITGVLAPEQMERDADDVDADIDEVIIEEATDDENQGAEGVIIAPPSAFSPALDPKSQPRSIGISFVITADSEPPSIDICATWARYIPEESGWRRHPQAHIFSAVATLSDMRWSMGDDVDLYMRIRAQSGSYRVSLYLVNQRRINEGQRTVTTDFVFQPQIRVHCAVGRLTSVDITLSTGMNDPLAAEDVQMAMLYQERVALARGHLCGAMWRSIDPERPHASLSAPQEAPFAWTDRSLVTEAEQVKFSPADVRSEFLPCYPIEAPETKWSMGIAPELNPLILSEMWTPGEIHRHLDPLVEGYEQWIAGRYREVPALPQHWQPLAVENLRRCEEAAGRIRQGIQWLVNDEDVRLAFCFANQAIALQSKWTRKGEVVTWRPFQLAFILLNITALADPVHGDRDICDLLWFPTGGGKTEAYLGLAALTLALRRLRAQRHEQGDRTGGGISVLSRYTLRLLTIQQFRRALGVVTACEVLRVANLKYPATPTGWRPRRCPDTRDLLWGGMRFSIGMWVGGNVTPNNLFGFDIRPPSRKIRFVAGALEILQGVSSRHPYEGPDQELLKKLRDKRVDAEGDPAQVLTCPVCRARLAIPEEEGLSAGQYTLHFVLTGNIRTAPLIPSMFNVPSRIHVDSVQLVSHPAPGVHTLSITFTIPDKNRLYPRDIDRWWYDVISQLLPVLSSADAPRLLAARPSRPGYFLTSFENIQSTMHYNNFEIFCPNPHCFLNGEAWAEQVPASVTETRVSPVPAQPSLFDNESSRSVQRLTWQAVPPFVRQGNDWTANRIPIPACTTDDQVYHRCPSMIIATVDKFARLAFEPKAASLFGNVTHYHTRWGYYRHYCPPGAGNPSSSSEQPLAHPRGYKTGQGLHLEVPAFQPPDLVIQDELHLLEGPLGSMVGLYETAVDALCEQMIGKKAIRPKYIASTATVRQARSQVQSLFARELAQFPPSALSVDDRFFAVTGETHPLESSRAGRLYVAVTGPGKGAQTPIVRIWSALLQAVYERKCAGAGDDLDVYWTLVGYFNALRELAGATALYRQDIPERIKMWADPRSLNNQALELSSRADSLALPGLLERLELPWSEDAVLATSMFGTGVDVDRLGLMVVHGQPKTTSAYIQATGRVGRRRGGLVVSFFRVSRPRDLDHYEFFTGYHRMLYRAVEPITVTPFAPRARDRGLGPLAVTLLRQAQQIDGRPVQQPWRVEQHVLRGYFSQASLMAQHRRDPEVEALPGLFEQRAMLQPDGRRPAPGVVQTDADAELDRWASIANDLRRSGGNVNDRLVYAESTMLKEPERAVVLGDPQHQLNQLPVSFENTPMSLRDVEVTTQFKE